jgi:serine/threonine protein kinase
MAPELWLTKHEYDGFKADVFACGVILFQMYVGERLFNKAKSSDEVYNLIMEKNYDKFWVKVNKKKANIPTDLKSLIQGMLCLDNK